MRLLDSLGPGDDDCKAGVNYREAFGDRPGIVNRWPCRPAFRESLEVWLCPINQFEPVGLEQATKDYDELMAMFDEHEKRILAVIREIGLTGEGPREGRIKCPNCDGTVVFSVASNGHRMAQCSTKDCVSFIE